MLVDDARHGVNGSDGAIADEALGQDVTILVANNTLVVVAVRAKIKIAVVTDGAVVMLIGNGPVAAVAADGIAGTGRLLGVGVGDGADRHRRYTGGTAEGQAGLKILDTVHGVVDACDNVGALSLERLKGFAG